MNYWLWLSTPAGAEVFSGSTPPDLPPDHVLDLMVVDVVDKQLGLCRLCDVQGRRCHVIEESTGRKLCPVLFVDAVHPPWTVEEVN